MSGHQQQPNQGISHQQMSMQRMPGRGFPVYGMPARHQVLMPMQPNMSQQQRMAQQPRYIIARPPPQNGQNPSGNQQMHAGSPQVYQQSSNQSPQMMHQMNRNQPRTIQPGSQPIQMMPQQPQGTPPNQQQNYTSSSPYNPPTPQQQFSNQHQMDQRHYNQPSTPQDRQVHQRMQPQGIQRPMTPQQQHSQSPIPRKNTVTMVRTNSLQNSNDGSQPSDQQHYIVQTSAPTSVYNIVQGSSSQPQMMHQVNITDSQSQEGNYNQPSRGGSMQIRHPVTQRPLQFTNQPSNPSIVRYSYPSGQQGPPTQSIVIQQPRNVIRSNAPEGFRQQYIQVVRSESDFPNSTAYRMPVSSNDQNYVVASQSSIFYRPSTPQQPNSSAIRQALENNYQPQIQTSQAPVIIQSIDGSNGQLVFKMPTSMQRQTSSDSYDSNSYVQNSVPSAVEATVSEYAGEHSQRSNMDDDMPSDLSASHDDASPAKKAKITPKPGKTTNSSASKPKSKAKKAPIKTIAAKTISTIGQEYGNDETINGHHSTNSKPLITKEILEQTAKSISQTLTLEEEAKAGVILYMEQFINQLVHETGRATNLRKSKMIQQKDVEYALKTKFKTDSINSDKMDNIALKFGK